jgi:formamidopyrimidine-DNA glycosylase
VATTRQATCEAPTRCGSATAGYPPVVPELPDVEGFRRVLADNARGRKVDAVTVLDREMLRNSSPQALGRALKGRRFREPERHGKWLLAPIGDVVVLMHFGMTGLLEWIDAGAARHPHDRIVFRCRGGELRYRNMRRFGGVWVAADEEETATVTGPLGADAADVSRKEFRELLERRRGGIKAALMDQRLIAGLGNLLVDEMLWVARIHPRTQVSSLGQERRDALFDALRKILRGSIPTGRVPPRRGWLTGVRDERDARCPRCDTALRRGTVAGRPTRWCPRCQPEPR